MASARTVERGWCAARKTGCVDVVAFPRQPSAVAAPLAAKRCVCLWRSAVAVVSAPGSWWLLPQWRVFLLVAVLSRRLSTRGSQRGLSMCCFVFLLFVSSCVWRVLCFGAEFCTSTSSREPFLTFLPTRSCKSCEFVSFVSQQTPPCSTPCVVFAVALCEGSWLSARVCVLVGGSVVGCVSRVRRMHGEER